MGASSGSTQGNATISSSNSSTPRTSNSTVTVGMVTNTKGGEGRG